MSDAFWSSLTRDLPPEAREMFADFRNDADLQPPKVLAGEVKKYFSLVKATGEISEVVAVEKARQLAESLMGLLKTLRKGGPDEHHIAVQAACRYFTSEYDGDDDMESEEGFDDDIEVMNAVARALDMEELVIDLW
ncbi:MAG: hypothetical protein KDA24_20985 [Deltaproteobacteria bacterium]|nr:hypothetical protein [Deltaproteobacteria bacterium]